MEEEVEAPAAIRELEVESGDEGLLTWRGSFGRGRGKALRKKDFRGLKGLDCLDWPVSLGSIEGCWLRVLEQVSTFLVLKICARAGLHRSPEP